MVGAVGGVAGHVENGAHDGDVRWVCGVGAWRQKGLRPN